MKKKLFMSGLCLVLAISLASCGGQQAALEPQKLDPEVQQAGPVETETTSPQTMDVPQTGGTEAAPLGGEAQNIEEETGTVEEAGTTQEDIPSAEVALFTDVKETVYATGTVNIRSSWSAGSDRLGSLSAGESVTRTGTSIAGTEAEGWSRVQLRDGATAYISNSYLSTTKPVQQQSTTLSTPSTPSSSSPGTTSSNHDGVTSPGGSASSSSSTTSSDDSDAGRDATYDWIRQQTGGTYKDEGFTDEQIADIGNKLVAGD